MGAVKVTKRLLRNTNVSLVGNISLRALESSTWKLPGTADSVLSIIHWGTSDQEAGDGAKINPFEIFKMTWIHKVSFSRRVTKYQPWRRRWMVKGRRSRGLSCGCARWSRGRRAGQRWRGAATPPAVERHRPRPAHRPGKSDRQKIRLDQDEVFLLFISEGKSEEEKNRNNCINAVRARACVCV